MITFIEKVIKDELAAVISEFDAPRTYLKLCTPTSGTTLKDKVIFLVFKDNSPYPFLCVKTVRSYEAKEAIQRNFTNLQMLNRLTVGSDFAHMFAEALYLHDDGDHIFSIERACSGTKLEPNEENLKRVIAEYAALQQHFVHNKSGEDLEPVGELVAYAKKIISEASVPEGDSSLLLDYASKLSFENKQLPRIVQHGDLTFDNILLSDDGIHFIDYDFVDSTELPGFDLFGLCRRFYKGENVTLWKEHLAEYFNQIGVVIGNSDYQGLFFLYHLVEYLKRKPDMSGNISAEKIIADYESSYGAL